ncbi:phosphoribosylamine--glycine ligase [Ruficoccus amylovorans]|uniref:Phosphoribosylamine--glycine ligase n=1 Tax=Ruficoccus amylovorans TaxID=1804625 RepID=A0A842HIG8_9BACT|nr:phosphoribosylamine--glycine ligase [Ruficoccus amylovorans]MBC2595788.1 phosphoribosylamine--glycine ligase [Ruficoccus amylovorans]
MKVMIIGSGGREHTLLKSCLASDLVDEVFAAPGNGGMQAEARCVPLNVEDIPATVKLAQAEGVDFVIVGPEVPLSLGVVDALEAVGIPAYGPNKAAARLEASKTFTKDFLLRHHIPTAMGKRITDLNEALAYLKTQSYPVVIKADGLAAGKGVIIAQSFEDAERTAHDMLVRNTFGVSGHEILIEEFMDGEEASIMLMVSGRDYVMLPPSQDHKRIGEGDTGPNTGGMGAYAPAAVVTPDINEKVVKEIIEPTLAGLEADGITFRGTLYIGIMIEKGQPKVVEFNVRFGDPETQVLLPLLKDDPVKIMLDCAKGTLKPAEVKISDDYALVVVMAAAGYPGGYEKGKPISFPAEVEPGTAIIHAGTKQLEDGTIVTSGGRVLGITGTGKTLREAAQRTYALCDQVHFDGAQLRRDIGYRQLARE